MYISGVHPKGVPHSPSTKFNPFMPSVPLLER